MSGLKKRTGTQREKFVFRKERMTLINTGVLSVGFQDDGVLADALLQNIDRQNKQFVSGNNSPLIFATLIEAPGWDGVSDLTQGKVISGVCGTSGIKVKEERGSISVEIRSEISFPGGDLIQAELRLELAQGSRFVRGEARLKTTGEFEDRYVREIGIALPLSLNLRKRVVQAGDHGLLWDTRHRYQFHARLWSFLSQPEHNWWRHFHIDQPTAHDYLIKRAEDDETPPLEVFRGNKAPGWMSIYDETGGVLFAYRDMAKASPKCLYADAAGGGRAVIYLHAPTHRATHPHSTDAKRSLFRGKHEFCWYFFDNAVARPEEDAAWHWENPDLLIPDRPTPHDWVAEKVRQRPAGNASREFSPYVFGGIPLPKGAVTVPDQFRLAVRGQETAAQGRPLAYWPDGSIKWLELVFPSDPGRGAATYGSGTGAKTRFSVSLRNGHTIPCVLRFGRKVKQGTSAPGITVAHTGESVVLDTGALKAEIGSGERWLRSAIVGGREYIKDDGKCQAYADFLRPTEKYVAGTTHPTGEMDDGPVKIDKVELQEAGPLRAVVRLEGMAQSKEPARVIIRLEFFAGSSFIRATHTIEFLHKDPREVSLRRMGIRLALNVAQKKVKATVGAEKGTLKLDLTRKAGLRQTSPYSYEVWRTKGDGNELRTMDSGIRSRGWLDFSAEKGGLAAVHHNMWQEYPKAITADGQSAALSVEFWPESAPLMDVRRYSNYPHRAQGETAPENPRWVYDAYYAKDPFVGISKTHEALLFFHGPDTAANEIDAIAADFDSRPLIHSGWDWYAKTKVVVPQVAPDSRKHKRFVANMRNVADWWMEQQKAWGWYGMWNYGDVQHLYRNGYGCILVPDSLQRALQLKLEERPGADMRQPPWELKQDYFTQQDWAFDNGRWGWTNTEGLPNLFMSQEYLRTGRRDVFFFMEAMARHDRDVDVRHAGMHFGAGTRHGVQHWSCGDHEERQTTFTELRYHYLLTGDRRTFEWSEQLTRDHYLQKPCSSAASHAGRMYGLLAHWEFTGKPEIGKLLEKYFHSVAGPDGININPLVEFPSGDTIQQVTQSKDDRVFRPKGVFSSFFHNFGGMHALLEYYYITDDEQVKKSIIETARQNLDEPEHEAYQFRKAYAFAAIHADDPKPFRKRLQEWSLGTGWRAVFQQVPANRAHWHGPTSFFHGRDMGDKFWYADAHYVMNAFDAEPKLPASLEAERVFLENRPTQPVPRGPRESWQSEYDRPEFADYIRDPFGRDQSNRSQK